MDDLNPLRRRIANTETLISTATTSILSTTDSSVPSSTIAPYHTALNGVNQPQNLEFRDALWWSLGAIGLAVLVIRLGQLAWAQLRQVSAMSMDAEKQGYWRVSQWEWMPTLKRQLTYAPLWRKRHNREIRISSAISIGTLPSRLHTILLVFYVGSNIIYMFILNWHNENRYAFCAELRGRAGTMSLVNMIPLIILAGRNNPLIKLLQISFDTYNLFHRWLGRLVVIEVIIHTIAWSIPAVADLGWKGVFDQIHDDPFISSGTVGTIAMTILMVIAVSPLRHAFYETFLNVHIILAFIAFVCTWVHCAKANLPGGLPQLTWIMAIMGIWFADRLARMFRLVYVNWSSKGFTEATLEALPGEVTRVTLRLPKYVRIKPGTHAYLRFRDVNPWESHPFSIAWVSHAPDGILPVAEKETYETLDKKHMITSVSFIIGAQTGMTRKLFNTAVKAGGPVRMKAAMEGPYAGHHSLDSYGHAVLFAGSTGITHQISYMRHILEGYAQGLVATRRVTLFWIIREHDSLDWVRGWMNEILAMPHRKTIIRINVFVTRPNAARDIASASATVRMFPGRPNIPMLLQREVAEQMGAMCVTVCGPGALADDVRGAVRQVQGHSVVDFVEESFTW